MATRYFELNEIAEEDAHKIVDDYNKLATGIDDALNEIDLRPLDKTSYAMHTISDAFVFTSASGLSATNVRSVIMAATPSEFFAHLWVELEADEAGYYGTLGVIERLSNAAFADGTSLTQTEIREACGIAFGGVDLETASDTSPCVNSAFVGCTNNDGSSSSTVFCSEDLYVNGADEDKMTCFEMTLFLRS